MDRNVSLTAMSTAIAAQPAGRAAAAPLSNRFAQMLSAEQNRPLPDTPAANISESTKPSTPANRVVQTGDTLTGLVKAHYREQGQTIGEAQAYRQALQLARHNAIDNPDLIQPGQVIQMSELPALSDARQAKDVASLAVPEGNRQSPSPLRPPFRTAAVSADAPARGGQSLLDKTLERAVRKGYLTPAQAPAVTRKVLALSEKYRFQPDDFARLTLMESGGMNPRASNGNCHGIIQFCDGSNRGAAAVGLRDNPRAILGMGLLQQLDLVDAYFKHVGLGDSRKPVSLDELYLSVLTPAARSELRKDAPLQIAGPQARDLHVGGNRQAPITRNSITQGLHALAERIFGRSASSPRRAGMYAAVSTPDSGS
ncbi:MAG: LysM peptidoglycan-binding domain-containing protein [Quisquiliibacterium sp.]